MDDQTIQPLQLNDTTPFLTKLLVAMVLGPKVAPILTHLGITLDPTLVSVGVGGLLHKLHVLLKNSTGWKWL